MAKVFISYRRDDSAGHAGRVHDRLEREFGRDLVFMDVDAIPLGVNFVRVLREEVGKCEVLLAIIGAHWLEARDETGNRRLDNPNDFVRIEIGSALQRDIPVIPILLDGARLPGAAQLPGDLAELVQRNALDVRHASFHADMDKLIRTLHLMRSESDPVGIPASATVATDAGGARSPSGGRPASAETGASARPKAKGPTAEAAASPLRPTGLKGSDSHLRAELIQLVAGIVVGLMSGFVLFLIIGKICAAGASGREQDERAFVGLLVWLGLMALAVARKRAYFLRGRSWIAFSALVCLASQSTLCFGLGYALVFNGHDLGNPATAGAVLVSLASLGWLLYVRLKVRRTSAAA